MSTVSARATSSNRYASDSGVEPRPELSANTLPGAVRRVIAMLSSSFGRGRPEVRVTVYEIAAGAAKGATAWMFTFEGKAYIERDPSHGSESNEAKGNWKVPVRKPKITLV